MAVKDAPSYTQNDEKISQLKNAMENQSTISDGLRLQNLLANMDVRDIFKAKKQVIEEWIANFVLTDEQILNLAIRIPAQDKGLSHLNYIFCLLVKHVRSLLKT